MANVKDFVVGVVGDGKEVMEILDGRFGVVVSGLDMAGCDGVWLVERIRERFGARMGVVIMTGAMSLSECQKRLGGLEIDDILLKPFDVDVFVSTVMRNVRKFLEVRDKVVG